MRSLTTIRFLITGRHVGHSRFAPFVATIVLAASVGSVAALAQARPQNAPEWANVLTPMTAEDLKALPPVAGTSGKDLPPGSGTAKQGAQIFAQKCTMCHGPDGEGTKAPPTGQGNTGMGFQGGGSPHLWEGKGRPLWSKNSYGVPAFAGGLSRVWYVPYFNMVWNAIVNGMPAYNGGSLTPDEAYSLIAFLFYKGELIPEDMVMNKDTLPKVKMPQRDNYIPADIQELADVKKRGCYKTFSICDPIEVPEGAFQPPPYSEWK